MLIQRCSLGYSSCYGHFRTHLCGYDLNLTYPQNGHFPTLNTPLFPENIELGQAVESRSRRKNFVSRMASVIAQLETRGDKAFKQARSEGIWRRDLTGRANGTIDPWYDCFLFDEMVDYALNFTFPWSESHANRPTWSVH